MVSPAIQKYFHPLTLHQALFRMGIKYCWGSFMSLELMDNLIFFGQIKRITPSLEMSDCVGMDDILGKS